MGRFAAITASCFFEAQAQVERWQQSAANRSRQCGVEENQILSDEQLCGTYGSCLFGALSLLNLENGALVELWIGEAFG